MKFTPSSNYSLLANSAAKQLKWQVYYRITSSLSGGVTGTTGWTEITPRITSIPDISSFVEFELGQFSTDSIALEAMDVSWWETNITTAASAATNNVEVKITMELSSGSLTASDENILFDGFIDKSGINLDELSDTISFTVYTAQEIGNRIAAENMTTQYIAGELDSAGLSGLRLFNIPGVYVTNAGDASRPLKVGEHTITYQPNNGNIWTEQVAPVFASIRGVVTTPLYDYPAVANFACGADGLLLRSTQEDPPTWTRFPRLTDQTLNSIWGYDGSVIFVVGNLGTILVSSDSGYGWSTLQSGTTENLQSISFDKFIEKGIIVGSKGTILRTINGGVTWAPVDSTSGITANLNGV